VVFQGRLDSVFQRSERKETTLSYILQDHLGSTAGTVNTSGATTSTEAYFPFGTTRTSTGTLPTDKEFTGQRLDSTGLYYYGARYYDPSIGRFISADTIVPNPANPQSLNRYSYCLNNPLKYVDPTGHYNWYGEWLGVVNSVEYGGTGTSEQGYGAEGSNIRHEGNEAGIRIGDVIPYVYYGYDTTGKYDSILSQLQLDSVFDYQSFDSTTLALDGVTIGVDALGYFPPLMVPSVIVSCITSGVNMSRTGAAAAEGNTELYDMAVSAATLLVGVVPYIGLGADIAQLGYDLFRQGQFTQWFKKE
jgi:RHS repeat-associated protein